MQALRTLKYSTSGSLQRHKIRRHVCGRFLYVCEKLEVYEVSVKERLIGYIK